MKTLIILLALITNSFAVTVNAHWNDNPVSDKVTHYELRWGIVPGIYEEGISCLTNSVSIPNLLPGFTYYFVVIAFNDIGQSEPSDMVSKKIPLPPVVTKIIQVVDIQVSSDNVTWESIALIPLYKDDQPARFIRAGLTTVNSN